MKKIFILFAVLAVSGCYYYADPIAQDVYVVDAPTNGVVQQEVFTQTSYLYQQPESVYYVDSPNPVVYVDDSPDVVFYSGPVLIGPGPRYHHRGSYYHPHHGNPHHGNPHHGSPHHGGHPQHSANPAPVHHQGNPGGHSHHH